jgi:CheY-like chemotaxis protein
MINNTKSILIVEDERILGLTLKMDLSSQGYAVTGIASSGVDAIKSISEQKPDVILMDIRINGEMNGIDTAYEISKSVSVPVIYLSGETDPEIIESAKSTKVCRGLLSKPVNISVLKVMLDEIFDDARSAVA